MEKQQKEIKRASKDLQKGRLAEDGVFRVGASRVGYAYIYEKPPVYPPSDTDLLFQYDEAGNQIRRETKLINVDLIA